MLALTQLSSLDACQPLLSVVNMLAATCDHAVDGLTQFDLAYLQGLYRMSAGRSGVLQRDDIADAMAETLTLGNDSDLVATLALSAGSGLSVAGGATVGGDAPGC